MSERPRRGGMSAGQGRDAPRRAAEGGEEALIQRYFAPLAGPGGLGLSDDCAVLTPTPGNDLVVTTDAVAEGVHFFPDDAPADIGWKALAVNVSDLAAKGARPHSYLLALAMPAEPPASWLEGLAEGLGAAQAAFGCRLVGGDTDRRPGPMSLTITAIGEVAAGAMVRRATAEPGCDLYVTGTLGDAALGLMLRQEPALATAWGLGAEGAAYLVIRYLRPRPRLLGEVLTRHARAAMDISDGLAKDLGRMARASGVAAEVDLARLPLSPAAADVTGRVAGLAERIVAGGDDYEILAAVPADRAASFVAQAASAGVSVTRIGRISAGTGVVIRGRDGAPMQLGRPGWDHFQ